MSAEAHRCLTCKHWGGPVEKIKANIEEYGLTAISPKDGWAPVGECPKIRHEGVDILVYGDGYIESVDTEAWFGCVHWETLTP